MGGLRIVLVEDNQADAFLLNEILLEARLVFDLEVFTDGCRAKEFFAQEARTDMIFLDLNVPNLDTLEFLDLLATRGVSPPVPVVALSGAEPMPNLARELERRGVADILIKPANIDEMVRMGEKVKEVLSSAHNSEPGVNTQPNP